MSALGLLLACGLAWPASAAAEDLKHECSAAYDKVQTLRQSGKLTAARREAVVCAREGCTAFIQADCTKWVAELNASMPTVVFVAHDRAGADTLAVRVLLDGQVLSEALDAKAVAIDPGAHKVRFEMSGADAVEQDIVIVQGVRDRRIDVSFQKPVPSTPVPATVLALPPASGAPIPTTTGGVPNWAWGVGGAGLALIGIGVGLAVAGSEKQASANTTCPTASMGGCTPSEQMAAQPLANAATAFAVSAGVVGAVGLAGLGASIYGLASASKRVTVSLRIAPHGTLLRGTF